MSITNSNFQPEIKSSHFQQVNELDPFEEEMRKRAQEERNRRFFKGEYQYTLPEDFLSLNDEGFKREDFLLLERLHTRCVFIKLEEAIKENLCKNQYSACLTLFQQMNIEEKEQKKLVGIFGKYGSSCDCEVLLKLVSKLYQAEISL